MKPFQAQTFYELLEVSVAANATEIGGAFERLNHLYSDDQVALYGLIDPPRAAALRARLREAFETLSSDERRAEYDRKIGLPPREDAAPVAVKPQATKPAAPVQTGGWGGGYSFVTQSPSDAPTAKAPSAFTFSVPFAPSASPAVPAKDTPPRAESDALMLELLRREADVREAQRRLDAERADIDRKENDRREAERRAEQERVESERREVERREASVREAQKRLEAERAEAERRDQERVENERREVERREAEVREAARRLEAERAENERRDAELRDAERRMAERLDAERLEHNRREAEAREAQARAQERLEAERAEADRRELERREAEVRDAERRELERREAEVREAERRLNEREEAEAQSQADAEAEAAIGDDQADSQTGEMPLPTAPVPPALDADAKVPVLYGSEVAQGAEVAPASVAGVDEGESVALVRTAPTREYKPDPKPEPYAMPEGVEVNGGLLRQVRMARGMSLSQVAEKTRIGVRHLENVEGDKYDALPAAVYLRGILMNLSRELGIDGLRVAKSYLSFVDAHRSKAKD